MEPAEAESFRELRPVRPLAGLMLHDFSDERPLATVEEVSHGLALSFDPETGAALLFGRNAQVGNKSAVCHPTRSFYTATTER